MISIFVMLKLFTIATTMTFSTELAIDDIKKKVIMSAIFFIQILV
jgi:hypothetical protein